MYKIVDIKDKNGEHKIEAFNHIKDTRSLYGLLSINEIGRPFTFEYDDNSDKTLRSSYVENYEYVKNEKLHIITTMNSIYYIEECE